jgi:hypothetical protein
MSQLGLGLNLSKTKGGVVPFNPLSLDPYLLFDTQSSMRGTLEATTLDLDPSKPDTLNVITAVRAGVATYTDASGVIQSANADTVRVDHVDGVPMILVEPSATNLLPYSEEFSNSWWSKVDATMEVGHAAPDGTTNAYKLIEDTSDSAHRAYNADITALGTISVYVKQGDSNNRLFQIKRDGGSNSWSWFDLQAGTVEYQTQGVASIEDAGNGWKRCTFTPTNANSTFVFGMSDGGLDRSESYQGDGTSGVYIWGAQVEAGSVATSYIPTSGSTVTRAADDLAITGSAFSDFYNTSEGTIYVEHEPRVVSSSNALFTFSDGTTSNKILSLLHQDYSLYINTGSSVYYFSVNATPQDNTLNRLACSFKANKASASLNGSTGTPNTGVSMPTINQINLGARQDFSSKLNGHIKRVIYWPTHSDSL